MEKLVLLDSNSLLNRAFYALPPMSAVDGTPTNAVYGYINMLMKIIKDAKPTHIVATFDLKAPTFRKKMYTEYKAQRKPMPEELALQLPLMKEVLTAMGIEIIAIEGYEADDVIGTLARKCPFETIIVTGDRDSLQLVSDTTKVWLTKRGITEIVEYDIPRLAEDGLTPAGVIDLKSLMGDTADNIPGVPGVGEKTAMKLLADYGNLDGVYAHIDEQKGKLKEKLETNKDLAYLSYQLATINQDSPVEFEAEKCKLNMPFDISLRELFKKLNFKSLVDKFEYVGEVEVKKAEETFTVDKAEKVVIDNREDFQKLIDNIVKIGKFSIYLDKFTYISIGDGKEYEVIIAFDLLSDGLGFDEVIDGINSLFMDENVKVVGYDIKTLLYQYKATSIVNYDDIALKVYLLDSNRNYKNFSEVKMDYNIEYADNATSLLALDEYLETLLVEKKLDKLYHDIELPLVTVLFDMETTGCRVDTELKEELRVKFSDELMALTTEIYKFNDNVPFNINSPKQLSELLFDKLGLKHGKKNKNGYSTDVEVLKSLQNDSEVIPLILRYRELSKLLSTYIDGLTPLIHNGRVHTVFKQNVTATGRLSSTEPNLQNIPVRRAEGRELRKMFVASDGCKLVCADYSQIELRLLAHLSGDPVLIGEFESGHDIHASTASRAFGVPIEEVTPEMRRQAKAVNFGIIYGISAFGLANDIGISNYQAKNFIDKYFDMYPSVKGFMDGNVKFAKEHGYVSTIMGRIRYIPEIKSTNYNVRSFGERVAMNMPLQGSASDIIKKAMIDVANSLKNGGYKARLILQVHDELLIDCPENEVEAVSKLLGDCMQNVAELKVKLIADVSVGNNWLEAK